MQRTLRVGVVAWIVVGICACLDEPREQPDSGMQVTVSALIGPGGGTLELADGGKVEIPPGALSTTIKVSISEVADVEPLPFNLEAAGKAYAFEPHATMFARPVKITLPFTGDPSEVRPMKLESPTDTSWQTIVGANKLPNGKVELETSSFSIYLTARPRRITGVVTLPDGAVEVLDASPDATPGTDAGGDATTAMPDASDAASAVLDAGSDATTDAGMDAQPAVFDAAAEAGPDDAASFDPCAINNGGCGDPLYTTCVSGSDASPTCVDVNECLVNNGGCNLLTTCLNQPSAPPTCGPCPLGYVGNGTVGCELPTSCKALLDSGTAMTGGYMIDPDGSGPGPAFQVYCDQVGAGGGWTLIRSSVSGGTDGSVEGIPAPASNLHLPLEQMMAVAMGATEVHIRSSGNPADAITSNPGSQPIVRMRTGAPMYDGNGNGCDYNAAVDWTGPTNRLSELRFSCCPVVNGYPDGVFHACNYAGGLTWFDTYNGWTFGGVDTLELYVR